MNDLFLNLVLFTSEGASNNSGDGTEQMGDFFKKMFNGPIFYVVLGGIVLLCVLFYLLRRITRPQHGAVVIIVRGGQIHKTLKEGDKNYFLAPFKDRVGAIIPLKEQEITTDRLYINNGPDALYQVNYTLKYKVVDPNEFYKYYENFADRVATKLNDDLREFADAGNALILVKDYRANADKILKLLNESLEGFSVEATGFKINLIQPLGRK